MARRTEPSRQYPKWTVLGAGPFTGVSDSEAPAASRNGRCKSIVNAYRQIGQNTIRIVGRPGSTIAGAAMGSGPIQLVCQFTKTTGTEYTVAISGGEIYTYSWGSDAWTKQVSTANLTTASITLSGTANMYAVAFQDTLVISDGVNVPITWDGSSGAGGLVELTNAPVTYGQPVVYYTKLFLIKSTERDTIVWSEEGTANTGYEAGGYNNAWSIGGTKSEGLYAFAPRNDSLGLLRARSTTTIQGAVNDAFTSTGTRASVSEAIGSASPGGTIVLDDGTVTLDADGFPQYWPQGGGYAQSPSMADDCLQTLLSVPRTALANAQWTYDPETNLVQLWLGDTSTNNLTQGLCFEWTGTTPNFVGLWTLPRTATRVGMVKDSSGVPRLMHGTSAGTVYYHGTPMGTQWTDSNTPITHSVVGPALGYDTDIEANFDQLTLVGFSSSGMTNCRVDYETPYGVPTTAQTVTFTGSGFILDVSSLDVDTLTDAAGELRRRIGISAFGRWIRPRITHSNGSERFGLELMTVRALAEGAPAEAT